MAWVRYVAKHMDLIVYQTPGLEHNRGNFLALLTDLETVSGASTSPNMAAWSTLNDMTTQVTQPSLWEYLDFIETT